MKKNACICLILALALPVPCLGKTLVVSLDGSGDFTDIQAALDAAANRDVVIVKSGEYLIQEPLDFNRLLHPDSGFSPKDLSLRSEEGPERTTIRGVNEATWIAVFRHGEKAASLLEGFTLAGAIHGGILCAGSSPTLKRCVITENSAFQEGGGVACFTASPTLRHCTIERNWSHLGGGFYCTGEGTPSLVNCSIRDNLAFQGAGVYCDNGSVSLTNSKVTGNRVLNACTENGSGHGVYAVDSDVFLESCTFSGNSITEDCAAPHGREPVFCLGGFLVVRNSIVWGNSGTPFFFQGTDYSLEHSCFEGAGDWEGLNNTGEDPLFVRMGEVDDAGTPEDPHDDVWLDGDYSLQPDSPCIDAGVNFMAPAFDFEEKARPCGAGTDMGAHESGDCLDAARFIRGDCNTDGTVDVSDAFRSLFLLFEWFLPPPCQDACDVTDDGTNDITDPIFLLNWLFLGGTRPSAPGPFECGPDPTSDILDCQSFLPCS